MQAQAKQHAADEAVALAFKRHILMESREFVSEPMADLYRVHLLGMMLNRYEELCEKGMGEVSGKNRVLYEFSDIAKRMREQGFEELEAAQPFAEESRWPLLDEDEAECYIHERDAYMHRISLGVLLCTACVAPLMVFCAFSEGFFGYANNAAKPKNEKKIKRGRFSLSGHLRRKLTQLRETAEQKARKRKGRGVAMIVTSLIPVFVGAMLEEMWFSNAWPLLGVAGMFLMIAVGVYELVMADGEKTTMKRLLDNKKE